MSLVRRQLTVKYSPQRGGHRERAEAVFEEVKTSRFPKRGKDVEQKFKKHHESQEEYAHMPTCTHARACAHTHALWEQYSEIVENTNLKKPEKPEQRRITSEVLRRLQGRWQ